MPQSRVWLITGASSGFGRCLTEQLLSIGEIVVATLRTPSALDDLKANYPSRQLLVLKCDVAKPEDIASVFAQTKQKFGRCDIVFNNAGFGILGEIEGTPDEEARKMFEVNFWGAANVNREAVKFFREENPKGAGGTLLVNSSFVGVAAGAICGYYSASKFALEGVTEALAKELDPLWNIRINIIEPGGYETGYRSSTSMLPVHPAYTEPSLITQVLRNYLNDQNTKMPGDPQKASARIIQFVDASNNTDADLPFRWMMGRDAIGRIEPKVASLTEDIEKSRSWSEDLTLDSE